MFSVLFLTLSEGEVSRRLSHRRSIPRGHEWMILGGAPCQNFGMSEVGEDAAVSTGTRHARFLQCSFVRGPGAGFLPTRAADGFGFGRRMAMEERRCLLHALIPVSPKLWRCSCCVVIGWLLCVWMFSFFFLASGGSGVRFEGGGGGALAVSTLAGRSTFFFRTIRSEAGLSDACCGVFYSGNLRRWNLLLRVVCCTRKRVFFWWGGAPG